MVKCYIGIGSNLGERAKNIKLAIRKLREEIKVTKVSSLYETEPIGGPPQGKFLNAAVEAKTEISAPKLLKKLKTIEKELGRVKTVRYGPRIIDLDMLLYGDKNINRKDLKIPHPKMWQRDFVLRPLKEIAPQLFKDETCKKN